MYSVHQKEFHNVSPVIRKFKRRECVPMLQDILWKIDSGMVRTLALSEDGEITMLGLWGKGDIVGQPLSSIKIYQMECLCDVKMHRIQVDSPDRLDACMWSNLHQSQALLMMNKGLVSSRLKQFIGWLADRFGTKLEDVYCIPHQLTHQDVAEAIGTTRVTVTRVIRRLEKEGAIYWSRQQCLLRHDAHPGAHLESHTDEQLVSKQPSEESRQLRSPAMAQSSRPQSSMASAT